MRRLLNYPMAKLFLVFFVLTGFLLPTCAFTCRVMAKEAPAAHPCCHEGLSSAKLTNPPCCEGCDTQGSATPALSSAPLAAQELVSVAPMMFLSAPDTLQAIFDGDLENHAQPPPLYLSLKTLLC